MKKNVLLLGAGLVARPLVRYLLRHQFNLVIATRTVEKALALLDGHTSGQAVRLDLTDSEGLDDLISQSDVVISLVPYSWHVKIVRRCIALGKNMLTTSYVSNEMRSLTADAEAKGLLILNELGVDPGIDHMSAMRVIHGVEARQGTVVSFRSHCGGLPAPDSNDNPWNYKFSWSPRGVLLAGRNPARFLQDGEVRDIEPDELFANHWPIQAEGVGSLEGYANRDSLHYAGLYGLDKVETLLRGTLRFPGWSVMMKGLVDLGWLNLDPPPRNISTYGQLSLLLTGSSPEMLSESAVRSVVATRLGMDEDADALDRMAWVGLFSDRKLPEEETCLDLLSHLLQEKLVYKPGQRDMIVLLHEFVARFDDGRTQKIRSTLVDYGHADGDSAMSRTVSLPCAIATRLVLEGKIDLVGVHIPVKPELYNPILDELATLDIVCHEEFGEVEVDQK